MSRRFTLTTMVLTVLASLVLTNAQERASGVPAPTPTFTDESCPTTSPNASLPPGTQLVDRLHGNGALWTQLWPDGTVAFEPEGAGFVLPDGSLKMKFPWWRRDHDGPLTIEGRRLDASAAPLRAEITPFFEDSGHHGFQVTSLIFPTAGCWEVTGRVKESSLTFVTRVVNQRSR